MRKRLTGVSGPWGGLQWETVDGDKEVARRVVNFLEDHRLLFGSRHIEDGSQCAASAFEIRRLLTDEINAAKSGKTVEQALKAMRAACRKFVDAGGPEGENFYHRPMAYSADAFGLALGDLRTAVGVQLALIATKFDLAIGDELAQILPPEDDDASWIPGLESGG